MCSHGEVIRLDLGIDAISLITPDLDRYTIDKNQDPEPSAHQLVYRYYHASDSDVQTVSFVKDQVALDSSTLARKAVKEIIDPKRSYAGVVLVQTEADRTAFRSPLAELLFDYHLNPRRAFGLSHIDEAGGVLGLLNMDCILQQGEHGLLVLAELLLVDSTRKLDHGMQVGDMSVALACKRGRGAMHVKTLLRSSLSPRSEHTQKLEVIKDHLSYYQGRQNAPMLIIQQSALHTISEGDIRLSQLQREEDLNVDFLSGDVWITLGECLMTGKIGICDHVVLLAVGHQQLISCLIEVSAVPKVIKKKI